LSFAVPLKEVNQSKVKDCSMEDKHKRGAPLGNHNALKHGFYSRDFKRKDRSDFDLASGMDGIDAEIALLRLEMKKAISGGDIQNLAPLVKTALALEKLLRTRHKIFAPQDSLENALKGVYRDLILPLIDDNIEKLPIVEHFRGQDVSGIDNVNQNT
jgi:hypothetical protein